MVIIQFLAAVYNARFISTHTLKNRCTSTDEIATCAARN